MFDFLTKRSLAQRRKDAKAQRQRAKKALQKRGSALRLCVFAREIFSSSRCMSTKKLRTHCSTLATVSSTVISEVSRRVIGGSVFCALFSNQRLNATCPLMHSSL